METNTAQQVAQFKVGQIASMRSPCDYECVWTYLVKARTAKRVTLWSVNDNKLVTVGIKVWNNVETCLPLGRYSMSPILRAA